MTAPAWTSQPDMEILDLRHFAAPALRPLFEEELQLWADALSWDYRESAEMILRYIDGKILPGYVALRERRIEGYCFFVYEGNKGVIGDVYAHRAATRNPTTTHSLLAHAIATLQQSPGVHRVEAQLLLHEAGGVAPAFRAQGFRQHSRLFMVLPLQAPPLAGRQPPGARFGLPEAAVAAADAQHAGTGAGPPAAGNFPDLEIRRWSEQDYYAAAAVIAASYEHHVDADINDQYRSISGSLRFLNNIVRFPGCGVFDGAASFVAIHRPTGNMAGLILCSRVRDDVGHITQICVVPGQRGRHLGAALMNIVAGELRQRRFSALTLTVTEANHGAVVLYERLGYSIRRVFDAFVWEG
jgi:ribosomal protein S18 acetylase RimI-like enzyme